MVAALNRAEDGGTKPPHSSKDQVAKARWSKRLADGCAVAIANEFRRIKSLQSQTIRPDADGKKSEPLTRLSGSSNKSKRIDVTVVDPLAGLHIGVSCKGFNFLDVGGENYDKNMSGRFYELADEMRLVHEHLPRAFLAAVLFLPLPASRDKGKRSSFAHMVVELQRERTPPTPRCRAYLASATWAGLRFMRKGTSLRASHVASCDSSTPPGTARGADDRRY